MSFRFLLDYYRNIWHYHSINNWLHTTVHDYFKMLEKPSFCHIFIVENTIRVKKIGCRFWPTLYVCPSVCSLCVAVSLHLFLTDRLTKHPVQQCGWKWAPFCWWILKRFVVAHRHRTQYVQLVYAYSVILYRVISRFVILKRGKLKAPSVTHIGIACLMLLQDEKNQIITTNCWLNQVSCQAHPVAPFESSFCSRRVQV